MKRLFIAAALAASLGSAHADAMTDYRKTTLVAFGDCTLERLLELGRGSDGSKFVLCVAGGLQKSKDLYVKAVEQAGKKAGLTAALKEYQVRVILSLNGIDALAGERSRAYEVRQVQAQAQLDEAWARVEIEQ